MNAALLALVTLVLFAPGYRFYSGFLARHGFGSDAGELVPFPQLIDEIEVIVEKDAEALGCEAEIAHLKEIVGRGTSAHRQVAVYEKALADGSDRKTALREVVRILIDETAAGAQ